MMPERMIPPGPLSCNDSGRIAFWSNSVAAAEAKKAEGASMLMLLTPSPPIELVVMPVSIGSR